MQIKRLPAVVLVLSMALGACGGSSDGSKRAGTSKRAKVAREKQDKRAPCHATGDVDVVAGAPVEKVVLADRRVVVQRRPLAPGTITLQVRNRGTKPHELVVVRGSTAEKLQLVNGTLDEDHLPAGASIVGRIEPLASDATCTVAFELPAADYVLLCNLVDGKEHHAGEGQVADLTVATTTPGASVPRTKPSGARTTTTRPT
jgi:hypothetical protein